MNILFLSLCTINTLEDGYIYADIVKKFAEEGHNILAVSPDNVGETRLINCFENAKILRVKTGQVQKVNKIKKAINLVTMESKTIKAIKKYANMKFDLIVPMVSNLSYYGVTKYFKKRDKAKVYMLLKDVFPQNAVDMNMLSTSGIMGQVYKFYCKKELKYYNLCDFIGCLSPANVDYIVKNYKLKNTMIEHNPNTIYLKQNNNDINIDALKEKYKLPKDKLMYFYGGNLGKPQGINFILECIKGFEKLNDAFLFIVGDGTEFNVIKKFMQDNIIVNTILVQRVPKQEYDNLLCGSDVGLIFLDNRFTIPNYPSRILSYMEARLPILFATDIVCDAGKIAQENGYGFSVVSGDYDGFLKKVRQLSGDKQLREQMGRKAMEYLKKNYDISVGYNTIMEHFSKEKGVINV